MEGGRARGIEGGGERGREGGGGRGMEGGEECRQRGRSLGRVGRSLGRWLLDRQPFQL